MATVPPMAVVLTAKTTDPKELGLIRREVMSSAEVLRWTVVDYDHVRSSLPEPPPSGDHEKQQLDEVSYNVLLNVAATQLSLGRGIFLFSPPISHDSRAILDGLLNLADDVRSRILIVECRGKDHAPGSTDHVVNDIPHRILLMSHIPSLASPDSLENFIQEYIRNLADMRKSFEDGDVTSSGKCGLLHFAHHHPLKLEESTQRTGSDGKLDVCCICTGLVSGTSFCCPDCQAISLHKSCAELPQCINIEGHVHPIALANLSWESSGLNGSLQFREPINSGIDCAICGQGVIAEHKPVYGCLQCHSFFLHYECAISTEPVISFDCHEHPLMLSSLKKPQGSYTFRCYACGNIGSKISYHCSECDLHLHVHCSSTLTPYADRKCPHGQPLRLTSHPPKDDTDEYYCEVCANRRHPDYWIYYCKSCEYEAHPHCVVPRIPSYVYEDIDQGGGSKVDVEEDEDEYDDDFPDW